MDAAVFVVFDVFGVSSEAEDSHKEISEVGMLANMMSCSRVHHRVFRGLVPFIVVNGMMVGSFVLVIYDEYD